MTGMTLSQLAQLLLGTVVVAVLWGLLSPIRNLPAWSLRHDKLLHMAGFAVLGLLSCASWPSVDMLALWILLVLAGIASEGLQHFTADRRFCWRDAVANAAGAAVGIGLFGWGTMLTYV